MFSRWIVDSGVSRGQRTSLRSSLSATDAARWIRFCIAPEAIVPTVPIEHGQITYASIFAEPDAYGAFQSFGSKTVTASPVPSTKRASTSSRESRASPYSSVASTSTAAPEAATPTSQSAAASDSTSRFAYGAPEAPVIPRKTRTSPQAYARAFARRRGYSFALFGSPTSFFWPFEASRKIASWRSRWSPSAAKDGIGEPLLTQLGHFRCSTWKLIPLFLSPSSVSSGAPRFRPPSPR